MKLSKELQAIIEEKSDQYEASKQTWVERKALG